MARQGKTDNGSSLALACLKPKARDVDVSRFSELVGRHELAFKRVGSTYHFDDFKAHGLRQALGYLEGYDRATRTVKQQGKARPSGHRPQP